MYIWTLSNRFDRHYRHLFVDIETVGAIGTFGAFLHCIKLQMLIASRIRFNSIWFISHRDIIPNNYYVIMDAIYFVFCGTSFVSVHVSWIETEPCSRQWHIYFKFRRVLETLGFFLSKCMFCGGICAEAPILWIASTNHIHQTGTDILKSPLWSPKDLKSSLPLEKETKIQQWNWNSTNRRVKVIAVNTRTHTHTRQFMANHENELPVSLSPHVYVFIVARFLRDIQVP